MSVNQPTSATHIFLYNISLVIYWILASLVELVENYEQIIEVCTRVIRFNINRFCYYLGVKLVFKINSPTRNILQTRKKIQYKLPASPNTRSAVTHSLYKCATKFNKSRAHIVSYATDAYMREKKT